MTARFGELRQAHVIVVLGDSNYTYAEATWTQELPHWIASHQELARHYGCAILPARLYKPKDKSRAEVGVHVVERWILARLRHHTFLSLAELNARPFQKLPDSSRKSLFKSLDKPALKPHPHEQPAGANCPRGSGYYPPMVPRAR